MRALNTLNTATGTIALGDVEFLAPGERMLIKAADSVATATLTITFAAVNVFSGPVQIESGTDVCVWPDNLIASWIAPMRGQVIATAGGTLAGLRVDFLVLSRGETVPW